MKSFVVFALFVAAAMAAPQHSQDSQAQIVRSDSDVRPDGYQYSYQTNNGLSADEQGQLKNYGQEQAIEVRGQYSYTGPDGQVYTVTYTADENGFHPQGAHLPVAP